MFRGEHINFLARLTLGQPAICPRAIWTLTRAKSLCLCAFFLPWSSGRKEKDSGATRLGATKTESLCLWEEPLKDPLTQLHSIASQFTPVLCRATLVALHVSQLSSWIFVAFRAGVCSSGVAPQTLKHFGSRTFPPPTPPHSSGGVSPKSGSEKVSALHGGCRRYSCGVSRYTVQLSPLQPLRT